MSGIAIIAAPRKVSFKIISLFWGVFLTKFSFCDHMFINPPSEHNFRSRFPGHIVEAAKSCCPS